MEIARPHNFVLGDDKGHEIDVHVIALDAIGNGIYGPAENGEMYPAASLAGIGTIAGHPVRCISPEWMVRFHSGCELKPNDFHDVSALCETFGIELPEGYVKKFVNRQRCPSESSRVTPTSPGDWKPASLATVAATTKVNFGFKTSPVDNPPQT